MSTIQVVNYDGKNNTVAFKTIQEAREFILGRIPEDAEIIFTKDQFMTISEQDKFWRTVKYRDGKDIHTWKIDEVEVSRKGSS